MCASLRRDDNRYLGLGIEGLSLALQNWRKNVVFDSGPLAPLCEDTTSLAIPEVCSVALSSDKDHTMTTGNNRPMHKNIREFWKCFWDVHEDRQTDVQTCSSLYFASGAKYRWTCDAVIDTGESPFIGVFYVGDSRACHLGFCKTKSNQAH